MSSDRNNVDALLGVWSSWTNVLDRYSGGTPWSEPLSSSDYAFLHSRLRDALQTACRHRQGESLTVIQEMDKLCEPWLNLEAVRGAEKHVVASVVQQSVRLQQRAFGRTRSSRRFANAGLGVLAVSAGVLAAPPLTSAASRSRFFAHTENIGERVAYFLEGMDHGHWLAAGGAAVVLAGILLLRSTRQY